MSASHCIGFTSVAIETVPPRSRPPGALAAPARGADRTREAAGRPLRVGFVGGHARVEREIRAFGAQLGIEVEVHDGHTSGSGAARLVSLVHRNDLIVLVTGTNSHNAVHVAKREVARSGARLRILKACGAGTARALLTEVAEAAA